MNKIVSWSVVAALAFAAVSHTFAEGETSQEETYTPPAGCELREGETHPDWATLCASGSVKIPNDETWVAYEEDMAAINTLGQRKFTIEARGTLVLDNTTTYFTQSLMFNYGCSGTIVKRGASTLAQTTSQYNNTNTRLVIENGVLRTANHYLLDGCETTTVEVKPGATLDLSFANKMGATRFIAGGTGYNGQGAIIFNGGTIARLELTEDTTIVQNTAGFAMSRCDYNGSGRYYEWAPGTLDMAGHTLTLDGASAEVGFSGMTVTNGGEIVVSPLASAAQRTVKLAGQTDFGTTTLTMPANAKLCFWNRPSDVSTGATLVATGDLAFDYGYDNWASPPGLGETYNIWAGSIVLADGAVLNLQPPANRQFNILGNISGAGNVTFGTSASAAKGVVLLAWHNTYTGSTTVYGNADFKLYLRNQDAIPNYSLLTVAGGAVYPSVDHDAEGAITWTAESILNLSSNLTQTTMKIDATRTTSLDELMFPSSLVAKYFPTLNVTWDGLGTTGGYTLTGPYTAERPLNLNIRAGVVRLSGEEPINLGTATVSGTSADSSGTLLLDGAKDVAFGDNPLSLGETDPSSGEYLARMIVTNSFLRSTHELVSTDTETTGALFVGRKIHGVLDVEAGAVVSNKLVVGGGKSYSDGWGIGAVNQFGGLVQTLTTGNASHYGSNIGNAGHGSYCLEGGEFRAQSLTVGGYSCGIFRQTGGLSTFQSDFRPSGANGGKSEVSILGGTFQMVNERNGGNWTALTGSSGRSVITIAGADTLVSTKSSLYKMLYNLNSDTADIAAIYNLNDGGVLETGGWYCYQSTYRNTNPLIINFNGGVLRPVVYGTPFRANGSKIAPVVTVGEKGVAFETEEMNATTYGGELTAPVEGGVQAIVLPEEGLAKTFTAIPRVAITGDGYGASAIALWDARQLAVTNILVTSHGWGYTAANTTVTLEYYGSYGLQYTFPSELVTIGDNAIGGFTKTGAKTLTLMNTNSWAKWTKVLGGTLKAGNARAIPNGTKLTLSNDATLDLNNVSLATFSGVDGSGGRVINGTLTILGEWELSARQFAEGVTTTIDGTLDLTDCAGIRLTDLEALDGLGKVPARQLFSATEVIGLENVEILNLPANWKAVRNEDGITLRRDNGLMLLFGSAQPAADPASEYVTYAASDIEIVIASAAPKTVQFASTELADFLEQSFGFEVPVVNAPTSGKKSIFLGDGDDAVAAGLDVPALPRDAALIKVTEDAVYIAGRDDATANPEKELTSGGVWGQYYERGTLHGVYEFLERFLGVRMYFPGELGTVIPRHDTLSLPLGTIRDAPCYDLDRRYSIFWDGEYFDKTISSWNKTICRPKTLQSYRNRCTTTDIPCCHGSNGFKYTDRFGETHPEYFALVYGNQRSLPGCTYSHQLGQLCWTSGILEEMYQDVKAYLTGAAASTRGLSSWGTNCRHNKYVDIMPQDGFTGCNCENCQAAYNKSETQYATDLIWGNTAALANRLIEENVPGYITMMSYTPYGRVPDFDLPTNILVMVAGGGPWSCVKPESYATEKERIRDWANKLGHKVWLWNYAINTAMTGIPQMTPKAWGEHYSSLSPWIGGAFAECESSHFIYNYLNYYVFGKICWDPTRDWKEILDEHYRVMFGAAAADMRVIYDLLERKWLKEITGNIVETEMGPVYATPCFHALWNEVYSPTVLERIDTIFDLAAAKVEANSIEAQRIEFFREQFLGNLRASAEEYRTWCDPALEEAWRAEAESAAYTNLIRRGGFEGVTKNGRVLGDSTWNWQWYITDSSDENCCVALDTETFYSGATSIRLHRAAGLENGQDLSVSQLFNTSTFEKMKPNTRYRLSFFIKLDDVRKLTSSGGFSIRIWDDKNVNFPRSSEGTALVGTEDWIAQSYEFTSGENVYQDGYGSYPLAEFRLLGATGTVWLDDIRLDELP